MSKKMFLIHVPYRVPGGEEIHVEQLRNAYEKIGYEVVLYPEKNKAGANGLWSVFSSLLLSSNLKDFEEIYRREKPAFLHVNNIFPFLGPRFLRFLIKNKIPAMMTIHNHRFFCTNGLALRDQKTCKLCFNEKIPWKSLAYNCNGSFFKTFYHFAALAQIRCGDLYSQAIRYFIAPSPYIQNELLRCGISQAKVLSILHPSQARMQAISNKVKAKYDVIYAGRLSAEKGIDTILALVEKLPDVHFLIIGSGPEEDAVKLTAEKHSNLSYLGQKSHEDVLAYISESKIGILASKCNEILSLFVLELANQGKCCVVSGTESMSKLAESGVMPIRLVQSENVECYAQQILREVRMTSLSEEDKEIIRKKLSMDRFVVELKEAIDKL